MKEKELLPQIILHQKSEDKKKGLSVNNVQVERHIKVL
jgi:hypothetical protein